MDIRVLGLGNVLMGDDAIGPYVVEALQAAYEFPANVSVVDIGTPGLDLAPFLLGADAIVVVDSVRAESPPGTVRLYRRDEILKHPPAERLGPHDPGFKQTLLTLDFAGRGPAEVLLVGVVPESTTPRARLSPPVRKAVPAAADAVVWELTRLGAAPSRRARPEVLAPWWERASAAVGKIPSAAN